MTGPHLCGVCWSSQPFSAAWYKPGRYGRGNYHERVSDIPIGSPPVPPGRHAAPSGWYADPVDQQHERYWDGWQWSRNTRPRERPAGGGAAPSGGGQPGGYGQPNPYGPNPYGSPAPRPSPYGPGPQDGGQGGGYGANPYPTPGTPAPYGSGYPQPGPGVRAAFTADGVPLASWGARLLAVIIDNVLVTVAASVLTFRAISRMAEQFMSLMRQAAQGTVIDPAQASQVFDPSDQWAVIGVTLAVGLIYHAGFLRWKGATPGKLAVGLRVTPVDRGRDPGALGWSSIAVRVAVCLIPGVISIVGPIFRLVDVLFPLWQPKRQALHDLAAKTQVVRPAQRP